MTKLLATCLVSDSVDNGVQGTQTVLGLPGDRVVLRYSGAGCEDEHKIDIGRPSSENNNGADELKHDIRLLKCHVVVFSKPGTTLLQGAITASQTTITVDFLANAHTSGKIVIDNEIIAYTGINTSTRQFTGCTRGADGSTALGHDDNSEVLYSTTTPAVTWAQVISDFETTAERLAQATIRIGELVINIGGAGNPGVSLPPAMLYGYVRSTVPPPRQFSDLTAYEKAIVAYRDINADSIDFFYVEKVFAEGCDPLCTE